MKRLMKRSRPVQSTLWVDRAYQKGAIGRRVASGGYSMDNGTIVHIDYDLFNADNDKLIETTREEVAKEHDTHDENRTYSPMILSLIHI